MKCRTFLFSAIAVAILAAPIRAAQQAPENLAQTAAESWLKLADAGDAAGTWEQAAQAFKTALTKEQWTQAFPNARAKLGTLVSRKVTSRKYADGLPGAPPGKYVIIQYASVFEKNDSATETITLMLDPDDVWRAAGYFVK